MSTLSCKQTSSEMKMLSPLCRLYRYYNENMNVRLTALKCLNSLAINSSPNDIIKYQRSICKQLTNSLDDKKRLCRQMAVESRNRWYLLTTKNIEK